MNSFMPSNGQSGLCRPNIIWLIQECYFDIKKVLLPKGQNIFLCSEATDPAYQEVAKRIKNIPFSFSRCISPL